MSETSSTFGSEVSQTFNVWRKAFSRLRKKGMANREFSDLVGAGCDRADLEWALFMVAIWSEHMRESSKQRAVFLAMLKSVLAHASRFEESITLLLNLPFRSGGYLRTCLNYLGSGSDEETAIISIVMYVRDLSNRLKMIRTLLQQPRTRAAVVSEAEALVLLYVKKCTSGAFSFGHVSVLINAAIEAHGITERKYDLEAFTRRYNRYKTQFPQEVAVVNKIVDRFLQLKSQGTKVNLVDFYYQVRLALGRRSINERLSGQGHP